MLQPIQPDEVDERDDQVMAALYIGALQAHWRRIAGCEFPADDLPSVREAAGLGRFTNAMRRLAGRPLLGSPEPESAPPPGSPDRAGPRARVPDRPQSPAAGPPAAAASTPAPRPAPEDVLPGPSASPFGRGLARRAAVPLDPPDDKMAGVMARLAAPCQGLTLTTIAVRQMDGVAAYVVFHFNDGGREYLPAEAARAMAGQLRDAACARVPGDRTSPWADSLEAAAESAERQASAILLAVRAPDGVASPREFRGGAR